MEKISNIIPLGSFPPRTVNFWGFLRKSTTSCNSFFASSTPLTCSNVTFFIWTGSIPESRPDVVRNLTVKSQKTTGVQYINTRKPCLHNDMMTGCWLKYAYCGKYVNTIKSKCMLLFLHLLLPTIQAFQHLAMKTYIVNIDIKVLLHSGTQNNQYTRTPEERYQVLSAILQCIKYTLNTYYIKYVG